MVYAGCMIGLWLWLKQDFMFCLTDVMLTLIIGQQAHNYENVFK